MTINIWAVLVCAVVSLVLGFVWYGPLFGKKFMAVTGMSMPTDPVLKKQAMKSANMLYAIQFLLALVEAWVLARYIISIPGLSGVANAFWLWLGFVMPISAGAAMWSSMSGKNKWTLFFITAGYQLVAILIFGFILSAWR